MAGCVYGEKETIDIDRKKEKLKRKTPRQIQLGEKNRQKDIDGTVATE